MGSDLEWTSRVEHHGIFICCVFFSARHYRLGMWTVMNALRVQGQHACIDSVAAEEVAIVIEQHFVVINVAMVERHANRVGIGVGVGAEAKPPGLAAAGAFMVALLAWGYLHAMQFIVIWAGDIPEEVRWYLARGTGGWAVVTAVLFLVQGFGPFFAILSPSVRSSRKAMTAIALVTLAMRPVEAAWLVLPQQEGVWAALLLAVAALIAMAGVGAAAVAALRKRRPEVFAAGHFFP